MAAFVVFSHAILGGMTVRTKWLLLGAVTLAATIIGVFVLPFLLPPAPIVAVSEANVAGFNNRVSSLAAAGISVLVLLVAWRSGLRIPIPREEDCRPMSSRFVFGWSFALALTTGSLAVIVYTSGERYLQDFGYFIEQMRNAVDYHFQLYTQLEFAYGPLLFYPPIWIHGLFRYFRDPLAAAYIATFFLQELLGALALAYVMQFLPIATRLRHWMFALLVLFMFIPDLGLSYTYLRFTAPVASLIFCLRDRRVQTAALLVVIGELFNLGVSPEMGFAFACGATAFALIQLRLQRRIAWLLVAFAPVAGAGCFLLMVGTGYLSMLREISGGVYNLIVEPQPYVLLYLLSLVWLVPLALVSFWRERANEGPLLFAVYVVGLALLPVAFGRSDAGHVMCSGLVIFLLVLVPVSAWNKLGQSAWIAAMMGIVVMAHVSNMWSYRVMVGNAVKAAITRHASLGVRRFLISHHRFTPETMAMMAEEHPKVDASDLDLIDRVHSIAGNAVVATPMPVPLLFEQYLRRNSMYLPQYYAFGMGVLSAKAERRKIAATNSAKWLLSPERGPLLIVETPANMGGIEGFHLKYPMKRPPFQLNLLMQENLRNNWIPVATMDGYTLYRRGR